MKKSLGTRYEKWKEVPKRRAQITMHCTHCIIWVVFADKKLKMLKQVDALKKKKKFENVKV